MKKTARLIFLLLLLTGLASVHSPAQSLNYKLESVFIYNFTKYIDWPADKQTGIFIIGVFGQSPLTDELGKFVTTKKVGELSIVVKVISNMADVAQCHIIYVPVEQNGKLWEISAACKGKPTLIVTEKPGMITRGAGISIFLDEDDDYKTKFELNKTAITSNGMLVSSNLLNLAYKLIK